MRGEIRAAARGPDPGQSLVPALVDGDDAGMPAALVEDFRTAGLTHLTAVSGANLTLVLAFVLPLARRGGVRARGLVVVGLLCTVAFVLLARPEPSVVRAAVMGVEAMVGRMRVIPGTRRPASVAEEPCPFQPPLTPRPTCPPCLPPSRWRPATPSWA